MATVIKAGDQHFIVLNLEKQFLVVTVDRFSGRLLHDGCQGHDIFNTKEEAVGHVLQCTSSKADFVKQVASVLGYVVVGSEGLLLVANTVKASGRFPGHREHTAMTVTASEWISIHLLHPLLPFPASAQSEVGSDAVREDAESAEDALGYAWLPRDKATAKRLKHTNIANTHFYCQTQDLTNFWTAAAVAEADLWQVAAPAFVWNAHLTEPFQALGLREACPVLMQGLCCSWTVTGRYQEEATCTYVVRQSNISPGTRYLARGLAKFRDQVAAANEHECEQLVWRPDPAAPEGDASQVLWSHYAWRRGSVPLAWASVIKAGMEICQVAPQPYEDVEAYWTSVWARHQSQRVCCVNLMRQGAASPAITSPRNRTPGRGRSCSPTLSGTSPGACPLAFTPPGAAAIPVASTEEDDFGEFVTAPAVTPPVHSHDPSRSRALPVPTGLPPTKCDPVDDFDLFMNFLDAPQPPPSAPGGSGVEPDPAPQPAQVTEAELAMGLDSDVVIVPSEPEAEAGGAQLAGAYQGDDLDAPSNLTGEAKLGFAYEESLRGLVAGDTHILHYDWHGTMRRLSPKGTVEGLWRLLADTMMEYGVSSGTAAYTASSIRLTRDRTQQGVFRFNCRDSLDRTNLCIFLCTLQTLAQQCHQIGIALPTDGDSGALGASLQQALKSKGKEAKKEDPGSPLEAAESPTDPSFMSPGSPVIPAPSAEWPFLAVGQSDLFAMLRQYPTTALEATAAAYVASGDVCAELYANSPAMHSGLLRKFAGGQVQSAKSNLSIGVERFYHNVLSDGDKEKGVEAFLGRDSDSLPRPKRLGVAEASRGLLLMADTSLQEDYLQAVYGGCGAFTHLTTLSDPSGIPVGSSTETDRCRSIALLVFKDQAAMEQARADSQGTAITAIACTSDAYPRIQWALRKYALGQAQRSTALNQAKAALQATGKLITGNFSKGKSKVKEGVSTTVSSMTSGLTRGFGKMGKVFGGGGKTERGKPAPL
mmetsp:Transcript_142297/g.248124  ORF Transcript_142297/g.248124 Transcript_142297/m.248124 type:complete len:988 (-) Transcript_142297:2273-5236(-)